jgi:hypothetical protein
MRTSLIRGFLTLSQDFLIFNLFSIWNTSEGTVLPLCLISLAGWRGGTDRAQLISFFASVHSRGRPWVVVHPPRRPLHREVAAGILWQRPTICWPAPPQLQAGVLPSASALPNCRPAPSPPPLPPCHRGPGRLATAVLPRLGFGEAH